MARQARGNIEHRGNALRVRISAGKDPATGERLVLKESVPIEKPGNKRSEDAAWKEAEKVLTRLQAEADAFKVARTKATLGALLDKWLPQHELDETTRMNYASHIRNYIRPALGDLPLLVLVRETSSRLEPFYADLRRCRQRCSRRPFIERHSTDAPHDCRSASCTSHMCEPYAASSVRSIHAIISGALTAAVRWGWIPYNPALAVRLPAKRRPKPNPPSSDEMAFIVPMVQRKVTRLQGIRKPEAASAGCRDDMYLAIGHLGGKFTSPRLAARPVASAQSRAWSPGGRTVRSGWADMSSPGRWSMPQR
jgi:integrase